MLTFDFAFQYDIFFKSEIHFVPFQSWLVYALMKVFLCLDIVYNFNADFDKEGVIESYHMYECYCSLFNSV